MTFSIVIMVGRGYFLPTHVHEASEKTYYSGSIVARNDAGTCSGRYPAGGDTFLGDSSGCKEKSSKEEKENKEDKEDKKESL